MHYTIVSMFGCMDANIYLICVLHFQDLILSGGVDATATVFNRSSGELLATLSGHTKRVRVFIWCSLLLLLLWLAILQRTFYACIEF
jgi:WD40 repeat protein